MDQIEWVGSGWTAPPTAEPVPRQLGWRSWTVFVLIVAVALAGAVAAHARTTGTTSGHAITPPTARTDLLVDLDIIEVPGVTPLAEPRSIDGQQVTVRVPAFAIVHSFGHGAAQRIAPPGTKLFAFEMILDEGASGELDLTDVHLGVSVDSGSIEALPHLSQFVHIERTYVLAVPASTVTVELVFDEPANGFGDAQQFRMPIYP